MFFLYHYVWFEYVHQCIGKQKVDGWCDYEIPSAK